MPIFVDGFDHYDDNTEGSRKWDTFSATGGIVTTGGRNNSGYLAVTGASGGEVRKNFAATDHVIVQYGLLVAYVAPVDFAELVSLGSPLGGNHNTLRVLYDGSIHYTRGDAAGPTLALTAGGTVAGNVWHYLEVEQYLSTGGLSTGSCVVKLDGNTIINLSSINNNAHATQFPTICKVYGTSTTSPKLDDFVLVTGTEAAPFNTLFGDWAVRTLYPNGAGTTTQFTPTPAVANYLNVDETYPDDDTTYVESATVGQRDLYAMTDLPASVVSVLGVAATPTIRKSDAGTRQFANVIYRAATPTVGATLTCTSAYSAGLQTMFRFDPVTGVAPTPAQVNAYEAGYDVIA